MGPYRTPGVYVEEISTFPPSVAEVETAIPAFIGYTEKAVGPSGEDLTNKAFRISSPVDYVRYFGSPHPESFELEIEKIVEDGPYQPVGAVLPTELPHFVLSHSMDLFFANGGGKCYVVSVGDYTGAVSADALTEGVKAIAGEDEPTLVVVPDAAGLDSVNYKKVTESVLKHCELLKDRFGILDVREGTATDVSSAGRSEIGGGELKNGAAYFPFLRSSIPAHVAGDESNVTVKVDNADAVPLGALKASKTAAYNAAKAIAAQRYLLLPPGGAIAGVYAATDSKRGVWKAPANVALAGVIEPAVKIDDETQRGLNIDGTGGKSINAIRAFAGQGTLVWGARTLAGNDNEWRYISVRRFFLMVEESVKKSTFWAVFEPNDANTWVKVRGMIENYLTQKWREGALAGATTKEAFFVRCGLGTTMSAQDILEGRMIVEIGMAVVRPAEFVILKFSHKLQTS